MAAGIALLGNEIQPYDWGSTTFIPELLGRQPSPDRPEAELWIGAHPKAPSRLMPGGERLDAHVRAHPDEVLGATIASRFGPELPFLLKVLAAERPLSIQCHPDPAQARTGFEREEAAGVPLSSPSRNYRDTRAKPELLVALVPFEALVGFRPPGRIAQLLWAHPDPGLRERVRALKERDAPDAPGRFFEALLALGRDEQRAIVAGARQLAVDEPLRGWLAALSDRFPSDVTALAPLLLNYVRLAPRQGLFLGPGTLHAYLRGAGLEIMASSDNVLRAGLTTKHIDVEELSRVYDPKASEPTIVEARADDSGASWYETPAKEFRLGLLDLAGDETVERPADRSAEILLALDGRIMVEPRLRSGGEEAPVELRRGSAALVASSVGPYGLRGRGVVALATVAFEVENAAGPRAAPHETA